MKASAATLERVKEAESRAERSAEEAESEKQKILADARKEAERILQSARSDGAKIRGSRIASARSELDKERKRLEAANRKRIESTKIAAKKKSAQQVKELLEEFRRRVGK